MDVDGELCKAASRSQPTTSIEGGSSPVVAPRGSPQSVLVTRQWGGSLPFAPSAVAAQSLLSPAAATSAGRLLAPSWVRPQWIGFSPSESALMSSRLMSGRSSDEHIVRRISVPESSTYDEHQRRRYVQPQHQKRRRSYHSTDTPHDLTSSTVTLPTSSWSECSSSVFASSSSFLRQHPYHHHHHHHHHQRLASFPYHAVGPSLLFSPWSVEPPPTRSTVRPHGYPVIRADTQPSPPRPVGVLHDVPAEHHQRQQLSTSGTDKASWFTAVAHHHCTPHDRLICGGGSGYQLNEASASSPTGRRRRSYQLSQTPPPSLDRQSLPQTLAAAPALDVRLSSPPSAASSAARNRGRFSRGSVIELGGGRCKRVEQLCDDDFADSAALKADTQLELITVSHIRQNHDRNSVVIGFQLSTHQTQVAVESSREHPFYVCGKGWCSCIPQRTMERYELPCKQLVVGDCCLALSRVSSSTITKPAPSAVASTECGRSSADEELDAPLDYSTVGISAT